MVSGRFVGVRNDIKKVFQGPNRDYWIIRDFPSKGCVSPGGIWGGASSPPELRASPLSLVSANAGFHGTIGLKLYYNHNPGGGGSADFSNYKGKLLILEVAGGGQSF